MKDKESSKETVDVQPISFGTVRFGSRSMPALTTALVPGLAISIVPGILLAGFMPQPVPWMIKALALSHTRELLVGNFGGSRYLAWIKSICRREHREPLVRKGRATFIPHFHGLVSGGCLLASLMGADQWALMLVCVLIAMLLILAPSYAFVRFAHHE